MKFCNFIKMLAISLSLLIAFNITKLNAQFKTPEETVKTFITNAYNEEHEKSRTLITESSMAEYNKKLEMLKGLEKMAKSGGGSVVKTKTDPNDMTFSSKIKNDKASCDYKSSAKEGTLYLDKVGDVWLINLVAEKSKYPQTPVNKCKKTKTK